MTTDVGIPDIPEDFGVHRIRPHEKIEDDEYHSLFEFDEAEDEGEGGGDESRSGG